MLKSYKKETGKKARFIVVPKGTSSRIVEAFEKRKVTVVRADRKATSAEKTKKLIKKARKNKKAGRRVPVTLSSSRWRKEWRQEVEEVAQGSSLRQGQEMFQGS